LSELADYRKTHGHCNVPTSYSENTKVAHWVNQQRKEYALHLKGKKSFMMLSRIEALESLTFEWKTFRGRGKGTRKKPSLDDDATRIRERAVVAPEHVETTAQTQEDFSTGELCRNQVEVAFESEESDWNGEDDLAYIPGQTAEIQAFGGARFGVNAKSLAPDKSAPADDSAESKTRKDAIQTKVP
jgi:hypothetical protein